METHQGIFDNHWHLVGHECEIPNHNDYFIVPLFDDEVVILNNCGPAAFSNKCSHMGARIFDGECGNKADGFKCKYHGLNRPTKAYKVIVQHGWIFVTNMEISLNPFWEVENVGPRAMDLVDESGLNIIALVHKEDLEISARWAVNVENALETKHIPFIHPHTFKKLNLSLIRNEIEGVNSFMHAAIDPAIESQINRLRNICALPHRRFWHDYTHLYLFPYAMLSSTSFSFVSLQLYYPQDNGKTLFKTKLYKLKNNGNKLYDRHLKEVAKFNQKVFLEDADICEEVIAYNFHNETLRGEERIEKFRSLLRLQVQAPQNPPEAPNKIYYSQVSSPDAF